MKNRSHFGNGISVQPTTADKGCGGADFATALRLSPSEDLKPVTNKGPGPKDISEIASKIIGTAVFSLFILFAAGCVKEIAPEQPVSVDKSISPEAAPEETPVDQGPREEASRQLTEQGRKFLAAGNPDTAIRVLEQAISIDPNNGQNYYYLAEAWLSKEIAAEAREFNRLAELHLKNDAEWMIRIAQQADRIRELEK